MAFLKLSFLSGDHRVQHYPWAAFYAEELKGFRLPWWTSYFHCGFPLLAEGQVGTFYPLNLIFYFLLPTFQAYTYEILFHYCLGGFFFYTYLRSLKLSEWSSFFGTLVYLFGTAQGGYYYNVISQKVLIWLPATFYLIDEMFEREKWAKMFWLALVISFQWFGGYLQYAVYSVGFTMLYFLWSVGIKNRKDRGKKIRLYLFLLMSSLVLSFLIALPQLGSTLELARFSNRFSYPKEFAYVGSMNPFAIATLFLPHWDGILGSEIYVGAIGLFFLVFSLTSKKESKELFFWVMFLIAIVLAFGRLSPLYWIIVEAAGFSSFRIPTKFIFFAGFALAVLCAYGFEKWYVRRSKDNKLTYPYKVFGVLSLAGVTGFLLTHIFLTSFEAPLKGLLRQYVERWVVGSKVHPWPPEYYMSKLDGVYQNVLQVVSLTNPWNWLFIALIVISWHFLKRSICVKKTFRPKVAAGFCGLLFINLYAYGYTSVKGNYETLQFIDQPSPIVDYLKSDKDVFRVQRLFSSLAVGERLPLTPHVNILSRIEITGAYSPLVMAKYYENMRGLGDVNDSHEYLFFSPDKFKAKEADINLLNVKYLLSDTELNNRRYVKRFEGYRSLLYENLHAMPRVFFVKEISDLLKSKTKYDSVVLKKKTQDELELEVQTNVPGYVVISEMNYPGWKAWVDKKATKVVAAKEMFQAVPIETSGKHSIRLSYEPVWKKMSFLPFLGIAVCFVLPFLLQRSKLLAFTETP